MSLLTRIKNALNPKSLHKEIDEELQSHIEEAIANGRDEREARRALGNELRLREKSRDAKLLPWLDSVRQDAIFGLRQLRKNKITSLAAILSLALALGATTSAFRLIDALLLRPLPIAHADRLYVVARQGLDPRGEFRVSDYNEYPLFVQERDAVRDQADLLAVSGAERTDITYATDNEMEKAHRQYISGAAFGVFGMQPALGRLLTEADDRAYRASPYAVLSYNYWTNRLAHDPSVVGRSVRIGNDLLTIVGVAPKGFTGTDPGAFADIFLPVSMHEGVNHDDWSWFITLAVLKPGVRPEPLRDQLQPILLSFQENRAKSWTAQTKRFIDAFVNQQIVVTSSPTGTSPLQKEYRTALMVLGVLVALVLMIACANVANLMLAQAAARSREMALRISIGAGRSRLIQLLLMESAWIALAAAVLGAAFAVWAAPFVVGRINPPDDPAQLIVSTDWRVAAFSLFVTFAVTFLFGLAPALRASSIAPVDALKGGAVTPTHPRLMHALIAAQVAFCFVIQFAAGLFVASFDRLAHQPTGFRSEGLVVLDAAARSPQPPHVWDQVAAHLRAQPGVESVAISGWPLLDGNGWNGFIWVNGAATEVSSYFLAVSPEFLDTMQIPHLEGRPFRDADAYPEVAIVNQTFVNLCFAGNNPVGQYFEKETGDGKTRLRFQVIGVVADARYRDMREPMPPVIYVPFHSTDGNVLAVKQKSASFLIRAAATSFAAQQETTAGSSTSNLLALATQLRQEVLRARPELRISNVRTQVEINARHTVRERLLATLAIFFATVATILAAVGLYGVLHYSVLQRRRELGIRIAVGAQAPAIARLVTFDVAMVIAVGAVIGAVAGLTSAHTIKSLLYQVKPTDIRILALPIAMILAAATLATTPAILRATKIDPSALLRTD